MSTESVGSPKFSNLIRISLPLMLTGATESLMLFADRMFLAHHSLDAMNAASAVFLVTAIFVFFGVAIAGASEVLAGQYNGEKRYELVSRPIWQMVWFSLGLFLVFIPLGIWGRDFLLPENLVEHGSSYFRIICFCAPLWSMQVVFAGFFATTGRPKLLTPVAILANLINVGLDYLFIFGFASIPAMGAGGAALATGMAQFIHVLILFFLFLRKKERKRFKTGSPSWYPKEIFQALRVGLPNAVSHGVEISAWALIFQIASRVSTSYLTVMSAVSAMHMLLGFLNEGLKQGVIAIASNLIGASRFKEIKKLLLSGVFLQGMIGFVCFFPMVLFSETFIGFMGEVAKEKHLYSDFKIAFFFMWLFIVCDGLVWVVNGVLTAGGDTRVTMLINIVTAWGVAVLPVWYFLNYADSKPWFVNLFTATYAFVNLALHFVRYKQGRWQQKLTS